MSHTYPKPIQVSLWLIGAFVFINLVTLVLILANHDAIRQAVITEYSLQSTPTAKIDEVVAYVVYGGAAVHIVLSALGVLLGAHIVKGKNWARKRLTGLLIVSGLISFYMFIHLLAGASELVVHILSDVVKLAIILLLWVPPASKKFFSS